MLIATGLISTLVLVVTALFVNTKGSHSVRMFAACPVICP